MPNRRFHNYVSRLLIGKPYDEIHEKLDSPVKILGRKHRLLFHDPVEAALIGYNIGGAEGAHAALLHVAVDQLFTRDKRIRGIVERLLGRRV